MISKMSHAMIFVNNQDEALTFYRDKLGFQLHTDAMVGQILDALDAGRFAPWVARRSG